MGHPDKHMYTAMMMAVVLVVVYWETQALFAVSECVCVRVCV